MAIVTRRYKFIGPDNQDLSRYVGSGAVQNTTHYDTIIDIDIDNTIADAIVTLDEYMASIGWLFDAAAVAPVNPAFDMASQNVTTVVTANADTLIDYMLLLVPSDGGYLIQFTASALTQSVT